MENCDVCGRFVAFFGPGVSWSRVWSYDMSGCPELHDPKYRCGPCTDKVGIGWTNCHPSYGGNGRNPTEDAVVKLPPQPDEAREGSQSPDDGRAPGIGQNPSETTTSNTERRV